MERKILRHVRRFLRGLVILKRHRADYYICSQFQVLLKHSVVPLAHVYAGLDLSVKKRKKRKKKRKDIRFIRAHTIGGKACVYATFNDPINFNEDSFYFARFVDISRKRNWQWVVVNEGPCILCRPNVIFLIISVNNLSGMTRLID